MKKKLFKVEYQFNGFGECLVSAENKEDALNRYYEGEFFNDKDEGSNYEANNVATVCSVCLEEDDDGRCGCTNKDSI